jgi:hypothetical protein
MVGDTVSADLELASAENEICSISQLLHGAEALVVIFTSFCYGKLGKGSVETLILDVNERINEFNQQDLRVICITRYS